MLEKQKEFVTFQSFGVENYFPIFVTLLKSMYQRFNYVKITYWSNYSGL